jgi:hypothetical protein
MEAPPIPQYAVKKYGKIALALVSYVEEGGDQNVQSFRTIIQEMSGTSVQGTAGHWSKDEEGTGLVYRRVGGQTKASDPAGLTKRCYAMAKQYKQLLASASPDQQFWIGLATNLENVANLIRARYAA